MEEGTNQEPVASIHFFTTLHQRYLTSESQIGLFKARFFGCIVCQIVWNTLKLWYF